MNSLAGIVSVLCLVLGQEAPPLRLRFSALDRTEKPVLGLTPADFQLRVNGWPTPLDDFRGGVAAAEKQTPLAAWILVDFNPRINAEVIANQASAAAGLLSKVHDDSVVGVKLFSDRSDTLVPLGHDSDAIATAFKDYRKKRTQIRVRAGDDSVALGPGGMLRAIELAMEELESYVASETRFQNREIWKAIVVLSDANVSPSYSKAGLYDQAARGGVFIYPVFIPRGSYGYWVEPYLELGKNTSGLALTFGALAPGTQTHRIGRDNVDPNAFTFNILNIIRDLNGKYSFTAPEVAEDARAKIDLRSLRRDVTVRLARKFLP